MNIEWVIAWSATKLHAKGLTEIDAEGNRVDMSLCGIPVFKEFPSKWHSSQVEKSLPKCKKCCRLIDESEHRYRSLK